VSRALLASTRLLRQAAVPFNYNLVEESPTVLLNGLICGYQRMRNSRYPDPSRRREPVMLGSLKVRAFGLPAAGLAGDRA
jgi:hypothetical protein